MDRLSQELVTSILSHLEDDIPHLHNYATISRNWQYATERITFRSISVSSNELSRCLDLLRPAQKHRCSVIKQLNLEIILPDYSDEACLEGETDEDEEANNRAFTEAVQELFLIIRAIDSPGHGLSVRFSGLRAPNDDVNPKMYDRKRFPDGFQLETTWTRRYRSRFIKLLEPETLPKVTGVSNFWVGDYFPRNFEPASIVNIATKFQNLAEFGIDISDRRTFGKEARVENRAGKTVSKPISHHFADISSSAFAKSLLSFCGLPLQRLHIRTYTQGQPDEREKIKFFDLPPGKDPLNQALHRVSQNLTSLRLLDAHIVSPELFWSSGAESNTPQWPNLKELYVHFDPRTPHWDWYFMRDPDAPMYPEYADVYEPCYVDPAEDGDGDEIGANKGEGNGEHKRDDDDKDKNDENNEEDKDNWADISSLSSSIGSSSFESSGSDFAVFRGIPETEFCGRPKPKTINPLLKAAARAVHCMPHLEYFELSTTFRDDLYDYESLRITTRKFSLSYYVYGWMPGAHKPTLIWDVGRWRPDDEVEARWREAIGPDGVMLFE